MESELNGNAKLLKANGISLPPRRKYKTRI
jgi:hypothetical protein